MKADYHVHCEFSDDSVEPMENQIERAIEIGLDEICFTDHVDYGIKRDWDDPAGVIYRKAKTGEKGEPLANVDYPRYFEKLQRMQVKYDGRIRIKKGLEFGIQTCTIPQFETLYQRYQTELDFVLLSMHQVENKEFWTGDFMRGKSQKEYNDAYYNEIYEVQKRFKHYSCLAHLDLLARYDPKGPYPFEYEEDKIAEILKLAIRDGKGIELNTSSWHYGLSDTQPCRKILKLYHDLGGTILTIGSDGHKSAYVGDHFADAVRILHEEIGFRSFTTFDHMTPVFHSFTE